MSNFIVDILEPVNNIISIETSILDEIDTIEIELFDRFNVEIVNTEKILWSDLPDNIPFSKISGNIPVERIENLDQYITDFLSETATVHVDDILWGNNNVGLSGYLNQYEFDCGFA
jgi:hypothetical protein